MFPDTKVLTLFQGSLQIDFLQIGPSREERVFRFDIDPSKTTLISARIKSVVNPVRVAVINYYKLYLNGSRISSLEWNIFDGPVTKTDNVSVASMLAQGNNMMSFEIDRMGTYPVNWQLMITFEIEYTGVPPVVKPPVDPEEPPDYTQIAMYMSVAALGIVGVAVLAKAFRKNKK